MLAVLALVWPGAALAACPPGSAIGDHVLGKGLCLAVATSGADEAGDAPTLVVVVHGDASSGGPADYLFRFARTLARPGVVSVAILRPGFPDAAGRTSQGNNNGRRDSYTPQNIAAVGDAIAVLKRHYKASRVVYVGHSGGAAIGGVLIGRQPGLVDRAVLVSCPCDIARWRAHRGGRAWTQSESPSSWAGKVPASTAVVALTGSDDDNTLPALAKDYVGSLSKRGVTASFQPVPGEGHRFGDALASAAAKAAGGR